MTARSSTTTRAVAPQPARRRLPAAERRALILEAALRTFAQKGYGGAAMDEIAAGAGISKAVVYDHVASKRELYTQLLDAIRDEIERTVEVALRAPGADGEERVHAASEAIYRYVELNPEAARLLLLELQGVNVSPVGYELEERLNRHLAQTLGRVPGLFDGYPRREQQLTILAELVKAVVLGAVAWWYRHPEVPRQDLVERTVALVWPAIERARGERPSRA
jgi:AcrR family transcriptional regulator